MRRALLGWSLCALVLVAGILSATLAAGNRARADELDRLERWCEAQARKNELARVQNQRQEGQILYAAGYSAGSSSASARAGDPR